MIFLIGLLVGYSLGFLLLLGCLGCLFRMVLEDNSEVCLGCCSRTCNLTMQVLIIYFSILTCCLSKLIVLHVY
jgi:hypothetical protein